MLNEGLCNQSVSQEFSGKAQLKFKRNGLVLEETAFPLNASHVGAIGNDYISITKSVNASTIRIEQSSKYFDFF